jgi:hypothetical protein
MTKKNSSATHGNYSQRIIVEEITDPEEILAVEELARRGGRIKRILKFSLSLSEEERIQLLMRLAPMLAEDDQFEYLREFLNRAPPDVVETIETELLARQQDRPPSSEA